MAIDSKISHNTSEIIRLNDLLLENQYVAERIETDHRPIFILGAPRSGTTLFEQLLISSFNIGYIDNITARFWKSPVTGLAISTDIAAFKERILEDFNSFIGFTKGPFGPHEFGYFWKRWIEGDEINEVDKNSVGIHERSKMKREVLAMLAQINLPLIFKNTVALTLNASLIGEIFKSALFIIIKREPVFNAQSLLLMRKKIYGSFSHWFSAKPAEYSVLIEKSPVEQTVGQLYYCIDRIEKAISSIISEQRVLRLRYSDICNSPEKIIELSGDFFTNNGILLERKKFSPPTFNSTDIVATDKSIFSDIEYYCGQYFKEEQ